MRTYDELSIRSIFCPLYDAFSGFLVVVTNQHFCVKMFEHQTRQIC